jgi:hypothetical protein
MAALILPLVIALLRSSKAEGRDKSLLLPGRVKPGSLDYRIESQRGYLTVYSDTDAFDDGGVIYNVHSSYLVFSRDGRLFKQVENHYSLSDEVPQVVVLPAGSYLIIARTEDRGYRRLPVLVKGGERTTLNLESRKIAGSARDAASARKNVAEPQQRIDESL